MRMGRTFLIAAVVVLLVFVILISVLGGGGSDEPEVPTTTQVVMVLQPINRGEVINAERLRLVVYPTENLVPGLMFETIEELVGKFAFYDLNQGVILTKNMVVDNAYLIPALDSSVSLMIPKEWVAVSIPINRFSSVSYGIQRGDHVNLIVSLLLVDLDADFQTRLPNEIVGVIPPGPAGEATFVTAQVAGGSPVVGKATLDDELNLPLYLVPSEDAQRARLVSQTLVQDVVILHVGDFLELAAPVVEDETAPPPPSFPSNVTIIVSPQDAVTLNYLMVAGAKLSMALRPPNDDSNVLSEAVTLDYLLARYGIPIPQKLPYGLEFESDTGEAETDNID